MAGASLSSGCSIPLTPHPLTPSAPWPVDPLVPRPLSTRSCYHVAYVRPGIGVLCQRMDVRDGEVVRSWKQLNHDLFGSQVNCVCTGTSKSGIPVSVVPLKVMNAMMQYHDIVEIGGYLACIATQYSITEVCKDKNSNKTANWSQGLRQRPWGTGFWSLACSPRFALPSFSENPRLPIQCR